MPVVLVEINIGLKVLSEILVYYFSLAIYFLIESG